MTDKTVEDRAYQGEAVSAVYTFLERGHGNPVVVAPTGAGKSFIIAMLAWDVVRRWQGVRVMVLADVKELIEQDAAAFAVVSGGASYGIHSASVGARDTDHAVIFAQVQSCWRAPQIFGSVDLVIIDECHMVNSKRKGMYRAFYDGLIAVNPKCKAVGFTATPYRIGHGYVFRGAEALFTGVAYEIRIGALIDRGFLVPPVARAGAVHADRSRIERGRDGEFKEESATEEFSKITRAAVADMIARLPDRRSVLVFACSVKHAGQVVELLRDAGETSVEIVTGDTPKSEREAIVARVRSGVTRWTVNVGVLTKGFDATCISAVVLLRATESAALYVQMIGRGIRRHPGKTDCVVLDYGENVYRHGPIDAVRPPDPAKKREQQAEPMARECPSCGALVSVNCRTCPHCGAELRAQDAAPNHGDRPSDAPLLQGQAPGAYVWRDVLSMRVSPHGSGAPGTRRSMRVEYRVGVADWVSEWVCPEHTGYARTKAAEWMEARGYSLMPVDVALAITWPTPRRIKVKTGGKWPEVVDYDLGNSLLS